MTREEFEKICRTSGYANKKQIEAYCKDRDKFTDEDFSEIMRFADRMDALTKGFDGWHSVDGVRTTKHYLRDGDNR